MKSLKIILASLCLIAASTVFTYAQCGEVRGVEVKMVCYQDCNPNDNSDYTYHSTPRGGDFRQSTYPLVGFVFTNLNNYSVSVEVELWWQGGKDDISPYSSGRMLEPKITKSKSFVLDAKEEFIWKTALKDPSGVYYLTHRFGQKTYFVKTKIYKCSVVKAENLSECIEVKNVETKYTNDGYEFINKNQYPISIDAEFWNGAYDDTPKISQTKQFVLDTGESYTWKVGKQPTSDYPQSSYVVFKAFQCP